MCALPVDFHVMRMAKPPNIERPGVVVVMGVHTLGTADLAGLPCEFALGDVARDHRMHTSLVLVSCTPVLGPLCSLFWVALPFTLTRQCLSLRVSPALAVVLLDALEILRAISLGPRDDPVSVFGIPLPHVFAVLALLAVPALACDGRRH